MRISSLLLALALGAQLAAPALAAGALAPARRVPPAGVAAAAESAAPRPTSARAGRVARRDRGTLAHITVGCATSPRRVPRPVVVIIPAIAVVVISVCIAPQDVVRQRRA